MHHSKVLWCNALLGLLLGAANADAPPAPPAPPAPSAPPQPSRPGTPPPPKVQNLKTPEDGFNYGSVVVVNNCPYPIYQWSVGAWYLGGFRDDKSGYGTPEDQAVVTIDAGKTYKEPYRSSGDCHTPDEKPAYCYDEDKLKGQGIAMKLSKNPTDINEITHIEYALYQNPGTKDTFKRLYYDISLLNCGAPRGNFTDMNATDTEHAIKVEKCAGYEGGVAITFEKDVDEKICPPIYCDGLKKCMMIYTWDKSRRQEASFTCEQEYKGDMQIELCVNKGGGAGKAKDRFENWAKTATHEVLKLNSQVDGKVATSGPVPTIVARGRAAGDITSKGSTERYARRATRSPGPVVTARSIAARNMSGFHRPDASNKQPSAPASSGAIAASVLISKRDDASGSEAQAGATDVAITGSYDSSTLNTVTSPPDSGDASADTGTSTSAADAGQPTDTTNLNNSTANPVNSASGVGETNSSEIPTAASDEIVSQATPASSAPSLQGGSQLTWTNASSNMLSTAETLWSTLNEDADCTGSPVSEVTVVITTTVTALGESKSPSPKR